MRRVVICASLKKSFFRNLGCINCSVLEYCAFDDADEVMKIPKVNSETEVKHVEKAFVSVIGRSELGLKTGRHACVSLSHHGVLAICSFKKKFGAQLSDLLSGHQVEFEVEDLSNIGFYDDKLLLLTDGYQLRECKVADIFVSSNTSVLSVVGKGCRVESSSDVSILHSTRELVYCTNRGRVMVFNVDTRVDMEVDLGKEVWMFASVTGIYTGVKAVFVETSEEKRVCTIDKSFGSQPLFENDHGYFTTLFPSSSNPTNLFKAVAKYGVTLREGESDDILEFRVPTLDINSSSIVRIYRDIFLALDTPSRSWVFVQISVP